MKSSRWYGSSFASAVLRASIVRRQDHLAHVMNALRIEEHVLGAAQADAFGAEAAGDFGIVSACRALVRTFSVRYLSAQFMICANGAGQFGFDGGHLPFHDFAGAAVEADPVVRAVGLAVDGDASGSCASICTAPAPATQGVPMPRATTAAWLVMPPVLVRMPSETCMPPMSAGSVSRRTRMIFSPLGDALLGLFGGEGDLADRRARRGGQALGEHVRVGLGVEHRVQQLIEAGRIDAQNRGLLVDQLFLDHLDGDPHGRAGGALAVAGLEHVQLALFDGELEVLHVLDSASRAMSLILSSSFQLFVLHLPIWSQWMRRADAGDDVFALGVDEEFAVELVLRRSRGCA